MPKRALITGITGQDGAYLARLLLGQGYEVYGAYRRTSSLNLWRLHELDIVSKIKMVPLDLLEFTNILRTLEKVCPDEVYNLAAQSFVGLSFEQPLYTADVDALGVTRLLEAIRTVNKHIRFYQASTSEMFGKIQTPIQNEHTPFYPRSPYGVAKLYAHWITVNYREAYGIHASAGILFNHESPLRGLEFVTRKITSSLARIYYGKQEVLELGNPDSKRDWGYAEDYAYGMWLMLQQPKAEDYVLATGENHSIQEFTSRAAEICGFSLQWEGKAEHTKGVDQKTGRVIIRINPEFCRPADVDTLTGNPEKAKQKLGWSPKVNFAELVEMMTKRDLERVSAGTLQN
jgi:GDPmannose 4,6-dehydratase